jgi:hypothetical protein
MTARRDIRGSASFATSAVLAALTFALWALQHPYAGIYHDAQLYTIQALARVHPAELAQDVFLRYGSQDRFTLFSPLFAAAIRTLGLGPAAAMLTFLFHCAFAGGLLMLARRLLPSHLVWLGVGLVCVVPLTYGAQKVFFVMEDFVTPRLLAQALVLAGFAALLDRRYGLALLAMLGAGLVHPIMALTGCAVGVFIEPVFGRQRNTVLIGAALLGGAGFALLAEQGVQLRFDEAWWSLVHGGLPYLFPLEWRKFDWARVLVVATVLFAGMRRLPEGPARALCRATLIASLVAIALSIIGSDLLRLVVIAQLQPWRVLWLASTIALLLFPAISLDLWRGGTLARSSLLAIVTAFLLADERFALSSAIVAAALVLLADRVRDEPRNLRLLVFGTGALLALSVVINLMSSVIVARARIDQNAVPGWLLTLRACSGTGVLPALVLCAANWVLSRARPVAVAASIACAAAAPVFAWAAYPQWSQTPFTEANVAAFSGWRARIPPGAEVLWFEDPMAAWVMLQRPSYVSQPQTASSLFSREAAIVLRDRAASLPGFLRPVKQFPWEAAATVRGADKASLAEACRRTQVRYLVTRESLEAAPVAVTAESLPPALRDWKLYICAAEPRQEAAP